MQLHTNAMDLFKRDFPTEFIKKKPSKSDEK